MKLEIVFYHKISNDIDIKNDYAYVSTGSEGLRIIDISSPSLPIEVSYLNESCASISVSPSYPLLFIISTSTDRIGFNMSSPSILNEIFHDSSYIYYYYHNIITNGDYTYLPTIKSGIMIYSISRITGINNSFENELEFVLSQNYPNPFNSNTKIKYYLPRPQDVEISVYSASGQKIFTQFNNNDSRGFHVFDFNASNLSSGVYFYRIKTENFV